MVTYYDIKNVNEKMHFTTVQKKPYAEVPQRVQGFRMLYPEGFITTEILSLEDGVCVMRATAGYYTVSGEKVVLGTGTAYEKEGSSFINKTSFIENAETSAVGRCLGFLGIGSETSIASAEEVTNAINNQKDDDVLKPGEKLEVGFDFRSARSAWVMENGITQKDFASIHKTLEKRGEWKYGDPQDQATFISLCALVKATIPEYKAAMAKAEV